MLALGIAAARVRPRAARGGPDRRPPRASRARSSRTLDGHERELGADRPRHRRRRAAGRDRRDHGRRGQRGARRDDRPPARGRELRRARRCCAPRGGCGCAPRRRPAGRRASTRTLAEQAAIYATRAARRARRRTLDRATSTCTATLPVPPGRPAPPELAERLSGIRFPLDEQRETLERLGFERRRRPRSRCRPGARATSRAHVDLVEEVVRFRIEEVPSTLPRAPRRPASSRGSSACAVGRGRARRRRLLRGVHLEPRARRGEGGIPLEEPYTAEHGGAAHRSAPRPARVGASGTANAGVERIALFELARVYRPTGEELPEERWHVAAITDGGFFRAKGAAETLYDALARAAGRARARPRPLGAHELRRALPSSPAAGATSSSTSTRSSQHVPEVVPYEDVITYPAVKQDLAFVVDEAVAAGDLIAAAREAAGPELQRASRLRRLPRRAGRRRQEVGRARGCLPVARADALGRGRGEAARADRRRARRALRRRAARITCF